MCTFALRFATLAMLTLPVFVTGCGLIGADLLDQRLSLLGQDLAALQEEVQAGLDRPGTPGDQGEPGAPGTVGQDGTDGQDGPTGTAGKDGTDGTAGTDGQDGNTGQACWDLNGNGVGDLRTEDTNNDGKVDINDCQGAPGNPGDPAEPGFLARVRISAAGSVETDGPTGVIGAELLATGRYRVMVEIRPGIELDDVGLRDFPLAITAHPAFLYPGQTPDRLLATAEQWELDKDARTLELRVFIQALDPPQGYRNAAFTLEVYEP